MSKTWFTSVSAAVAATLILATSPPGATALPGAAVPSVPSLAVGQADPALPAADEVVTPNPAYQSAPFEGWGNSLVWFANATGNYPDALKNQLFNLVFGREGMNLNVARYNIGGGNSSDTPSYLRPGADVPGWWKDQIPKAGGGTVDSTYANRQAYLQSWNPTGEQDFDTYFDDSKDSSQLWWLDKIAQTRDDAVFEAFSNSPPFFQTESGFTSGDWSSSSKQNADGAGDHALAATDGAPEKFAKYLALVVDHIEKTHPGVTFQSVEPFNESTEGYWHTPDANPPSSWPAPGRIQEGGTFSPGPGANDMQNVITQLRSALDSTDSHAVVSATDANWPQRAVDSWNAFSPAVQSKVGQLNVHTYGDDGSLAANATAKASGRDLWMSEVGLDGVGSGFDPVSIAGGLSIASKINSGMRNLQPGAYVQWQEVEDYYNMEKLEKLNWGSVFIDLDCAYFSASGTRLPSATGSIGFKSIRRVAAAGAANVAAVPDCSIVTNSKYDVIRNYTHYINPGDRIVQTTSGNATAALDGNGDGGLSVVYANSGATPKTVRLDLSDFASVAPNTLVTPIVTTQAATVNDTSTALVAGTPVVIDTATRSATLTVPARSVTTFEITNGLSGVAADAYAFEDGQRYQIASSTGTVLTEGPSTVSATAPGAATAAVAGQLFTAHRVAGAATDDDQTFVLEAPSGKFLTASAVGTLALTTSSLAQAGANPEATWYLHTTDGKTWDLLSKASARVLSASGTVVSTATASGDASQRWTFRSTTPSGAVTQVLATPVGAVPTLPAQVVPTYPWGDGVPVDVTWSTTSLPGDVSHAGTVTVNGTATDVYGNAFTAQTLVVVGAYSATQAASLDAVAGTTLAALTSQAPPTVAATIGENPQQFPAAVTWDWGGLTDASLAHAGILTVHGTAASNDPGGPAVAAVLTVKVYEVGASGNLLAASNTSSTLVISHTEGGHPEYANGSLLRDGNTTNKAWTNWNNQSPTVTMDALFRASAGGSQLAVVTGLTFSFYRDSSSATWPATYTLQRLAADGTTWVDVPGYAAPVAVPGANGSTAPTLTVTFPAPVVTTGLRISLNDAVSGTYMAGSELQVWGAVVTAAPAPPVDTLALQTVVATADALTSTDFTTSWWQSLQDALTDARTTLVDESASQSVVDGATMILQALLATPALRGDGAPLAAVVAFVDDLRAGLDDATYTVESLAALDGALATAHDALIHRADKTQAQLDTALASLQTAAHGLETVTPPDTAEPKVALQAAVDAAKAIAGARPLFTTASWDTLQDAIGAAEHLLASPVVTQEQADAGVAAIVAAISGLAHKAPPVVTPTPPVDSTGRVAKVKAAQSTVRLIKGTSVKIPALAYTAGGTKATAKVRWTSSKAKVAKVSSAGKITAKKVGRATITVKAGGKRTTIKVRVVSKKTAARSRSTVMKVTVSVPQSLTVGQVGWAKGGYKPSSAVRARVTYRSTKPSVLKVDKAGRLRTVSSGKARVVVTVGKVSKKSVVVNVTSR